MSWIQTYTGRRFSLSKPDPADVDIIDIAVALSRIPRFGGHSLVFYSVAQHSAIASDYCPAYELEALLHDAAEAYVGDMTRPLKQILSLGENKFVRSFSDVEEAVYSAIAVRFGLPPYVPQQVKRVDERMLMTERRDLLKWTPELWTVDAAPFEFEIEAMTPEGSLAYFLRRFEKLTGETVNWSALPRAAA